MKSVSITVNVEEEGRQGVDGEEAERQVGLWVRIRYKNPNISFITLVGRRL